MASEKQWNCVFKIQYLQIFPKLRQQKIQEHKIKAKSFSQSWKITSSCSSENRKSAKKVGGELRTNSAILFTMVLALQHVRPTQEFRAMRTSSLWLASFDKWKALLKYRFLKDKQKYRAQKAFNWSRKRALLKTVTALCISQFQKYPCPLPPPPQPNLRASAFFLNGKFLGVRTNKSIKCPGEGPKRRQMPHPRDHPESNTAQDLIQCKSYREIVGCLPMRLSYRCSFALMPLINNTPNAYTTIA